MGDVFSQEIYSDSGLQSKNKYIIFFLKFIINESLNNAGLAGAAVSEEDDLVGPFTDGGRSN
jgi:hypothetical protein